MIQAITYNNLSKYTCLFCRKFCRLDFTDEKILCQCHKCKLFGIETEQCVRWLYLGQGLVQGKALTVVTILWNLFCVRPTIDYYWNSLQVYMYLYVYNYQLIVRLFLAKKGYLKKIINPGSSITHKMKFKTTFWLEMKIANISIKGADFLELSKRRKKVLHTLKNCTFGKYSDCFSRYHSPVRAQKLFAHVRMLMIW